MLKTQIFVTVRSLKLFNYDSNFATSLSYPHFFSRLFVILTIFGHPELQYCITIYISVGWHIPTVHKNQINRSVPGFSLHLNFFFNKHRMTNAVLFFRSLAIAGGKNWQNNYPKTSVVHPDPIYTVNQFQLNYWQILSAFTWWGCCKIFM